MNTDLLVLLLLSCLTAFFWNKLIKREVLLDYAAIQADGSKNSLGKAWHAKSAVKVGIWAAVHAVMFAYFNVAAAVSMFFLLLAIFWKYFDQLLNLKLNKAKDYVGQTASIDKFFRDYDPYNPEITMRRAKHLLIGASGLAVVVSLAVHFLSS